MKEKNKNAKLLWMLFVVICALGILKIFHIPSKVFSYLHEIHDTQYRNKVIGIDLSKYDEIHPDDSAWFNEYSVIAHSGGGILG